MNTDAEAGRSSFNAGSVIFEEGKQGDAVYLIVGGEVEIRVGVRTEHPRTLGKVTKGEVIGEMALIDDQPHTATAVAVTDTTALVMSRQAFRKRIDEMDPLMKGVLRIMVKRLREVVGKLHVEKPEVNLAGWQRKK